MQCSKQALSVAGVAQIDVVPCWKAVTTAALTFQVLLQLSIAVRVAESKEHLLSRCRKAVAKGEL
jgi:hypothetical protein